MNKVHIKLPYLIFLGDVTDLTLAKTGAGLAQWCKDDVVGQLRLTPQTVDLDIPELSIEQAIKAGVKSLVIGVATVGGTVQKHWIPTLVQALQGGLDIVNGLHADLRKIEALASAEYESTGNIVNIRVNPPNLPIGTGVKRSGQRLLTVGTDCAVGKKYTALALAKALRKNGIAATFRATGQTGVMIAGEGIAVDCVISDFLSGAAEVISPANEPMHWDIIEGQGSLFNPSFSAVSMGLLHGSQPDLIIICHDAKRTHMSSCPEQVLPSIRECIDLHLQCAHIVNSETRCIGVSVNTSGLTEVQSSEYLAKLEHETGLPCIDPIKQGCDEFVKKISTIYSQSASLSAKV